MYMYVGPLCCKHIEKLEQARKGTWDMCSKQSKHSQRRSGHNNCFVSNPKRERGLQIKEWLQTDGENIVKNYYADNELKLTDCMPTSSLHEVTRATVLARLLYAASAWRGFATAQDCSRIDRFINRAFNLGYLLADCHTFNSLVNMAENRLLSSVIRNSYHVLRPLIPPILSCTRRNGLRKRAHPFTIPLV